MFYVSDDFGTGGLSVIEEYFNENGIEYAAEAYNAGDTDVSGHILSLMNAGVDCIIMWAHGVDLPVIARTMGQLGWDKPVVTSSGSAQAMYLEMCEPEWVEGWYCVAEYADTNTAEVAQNYAKNFEAMTGEAGGIFCGTFYWWF